jgi:hypothetical protein
MSANPRRTMYHNQPSTLTNNYSKGNCTCSFLLDALVRR